MAGIVSYGAYVPYWRLDRARIAEALGQPAGRGTRAVASFDEDTTSMGVEAARLALRAAPAAPAPDSLLFATAAPAYLDKTNATAVHAALGLGSSVPAYDMAGSVRSGAGALALGRGLVVLSDIRTGLPGGADERDGGDAAAAFLFGDGDAVLAERLSAASATAEFLDRWRIPGEPASRTWEERFGEHVYTPLAEAALTDALKQAGLTQADVDVLLVAGASPRAAKRLGAARDEVTPAVGNAGAAQAGLLLADALDRAEPGQLLVLAVLADGCDVTVWRATDAIRDFRPATTVRRQIDAGRTDLPYASFLTWRGMLHREPPRRPDPDRPAAPPSYRNDDWKYGFTGSRCEECGTRHLPPQRVCVRCGAVDRMSVERLADVPATVATFTVDRLAFSLSPPVVAAVIDFDGGGRFQCELTDVDAGEVAIGQRVEMTFRRLFTAGGVHNYFWKARPLRTEEA